MDGEAEKGRSTTSSHTAIPLAPLPDNVAERVRQAGAPGANLYRALAHAPRLLEAWIDFAWALREHCDTPPSITRVDHLTHRPMHALTVRVDSAPPYGRTS